MGCTWGVMRGHGVHLRIAAGAWGGMMDARCLNAAKTAMLGCGRERVWRLGGRAGRLWNGTPHLELTELISS
eukprot:4524056-Prymnesium_polylepis.1